MLVRSCLPPFSHSFFPAPRLLSWLFLVINTISDNMDLGIVFARSLAGLMDGNVGVVKTVIGELTDDSNRAMAFRLWPITWIVGGTLGEQLMFVD